MERELLADKAPRVAVVILTWNRVDDVVTCLESFSELDYDNYEVLLVDNASEDATVPTVRERFPWAHLIVNSENLGYVGGNNIGMKHALERGADYVFLLNSDTKITRNVLRELVAVMEADRRIGIAGAKNLLFSDPSYTWGKYGVLNWGPMLVRTHGRFEPDRPEPSPQDVDWVIGNGCLMSREALERVGLFDEEFFQVNEDVDWCLRARSLGYRIVYVDTAAIHHKGASSADLTKPVVFSYGYFLGRNAILFARKHANAWQWALLLANVTLGIVLRASLHAAYAAVFAASGQKHFIAGVTDGFRGTLRRERITIRMPVTAPPPRPPTRFVRFLRWLGI